MVFQFGAKRATRVEYSPPRRTTPPAGAAGQSGDDLLHDRAEGGSFVVVEVSDITMSQSFDRGRHHGALDQNVVGVALVPFRIHAAISYRAQLMWPPVIVESGKPRGDDVIEHGPVLRRRTQRCVSGDVDCTRVIQADARNGFDECYRPVLRDLHARRTQSVNQGE
ncbi:hypothetical protein [Gordonia mangrovi]|uniref:hypothetical protein n=1 Tax=Gordonia mangrovi TaxID=2665643 RepID=UPI0021ABD1A7|nr:hypothetical protein [Gordonia mangrovi]UVF80941.1 hypothetical protein NWF22_15085 [Gordonia mangrovi]